MSLFNSVPVKKPTSSVFSLSHSHAFSCSSQRLIPCFVKEVVPGTKLSIDISTFARLQPMVAPVFGDMRIKFEAFFVPNRIVMKQKDWEKFITGGINQAFDDTDIFAPYVDLIAIGQSLKVDLTNDEVLKNSTLLDFMGIRLRSMKGVTSYRVSLLKWLAYIKIFIDWYIPEALMPWLINNVDFENITAGDNTQNILVTELFGLFVDTFISSNGIETRCFKPLPRYLRRDYFTSALPEPQSGVDVANLDLGLQLNWNNPKQDLPLDTKGTSFQAPINGEYANISYKDFVREGNFTSPIDVEKFGTSLKANGFTIPKLRLLNKLQQWLERNAVAGNRYCEQLAAHFGVRPKDARLQRPEFLGRMQQEVQIGDVPQTYGDDVTEKQVLGRLGGRGVSVGQSDYIHSFADEHGYVFVLCSVMPSLSYSDGVDRDNKRFSRFDFAFPEFGNLGEQPVYNYEISPNALPDGDLSEFGYQSRYSEYKTMLNRTSGDLRHTLGYWALQRQFKDTPVLNAEFLVDRNAVNNIFHVVEEKVQGDPFIIYAQFGVKAREPFPYYGTPLL